MEIKTDAQSVIKEWQACQDFNNNLEGDYYETIERNERFYNGDQWYGVKAPEMMKPVNNYIKRFADYLVAMLVSNDVTVSAESFYPSEESNAETKIFVKEIEKAMEVSRFKEQNREAIKSCCITGDVYYHTYFDVNEDTGQAVKGMIKSEKLDCTNVGFGNPYTNDIQGQPYIIISQRVFLEQAKDRARNYGCSEEVIEGLTADNDGFDTRDKSENLTTILIKFYKKENKQGMKTVHYVIVCSNQVIKEETDLEYKHYPISSMLWNKQKYNYHGISPVTGSIQSQIFINKMMAMAMVYTTNNAFPRILFDRNKIKSLTTDLTKAISVQNMDTLGKVLDAIQTPDFSNRVIEMINLAKEMMKETMGVTDAGLGDVKPDNTSAIIAVQQSTALPLEMQRLAYHDFIEQTVRIMVDIMTTDYGVRLCQYTDDNGNKQVVQLDFSTFDGINARINVDVGDSAYWSEITQVQTMDNLFAQQIITNPIDYLENIPDRYIKNKQKLLEKLKLREAEQQEMAMLQQQQQQLQQLGN